MDETIGYNHYGYQQCLSNEEESIDSFLQRSTGVNGHDDLYDLCELRGYPNNWSLLADSDLCCSSTESLYYFLTRREATQMIRVGA